jgi:hypothetical protein
MTMLAALDKVLPARHPRGLLRINAPEVFSIDGSRSAKGRIRR